MYMSTNIHCWDDMRSGGCCEIGFMTTYSEFYIG